MGRGWVRKGLGSEGAGFGRGWVRKGLGSEGAGFEASDLAISHQKVRGHHVHKVGEVLQL